MRFEDVARVWRVRRVEQIGRVAEHESRSSAREEPRRSRQRVPPLDRCRHSVFRQCQ
jgi:hypothetical protein